MKAVLRDFTSHNVPTGLPEEGPRTAAWPSLVFNKIRSLWSAHSSVPQGLNQLTGTEKLLISRRNVDFITVDEDINKRNLVQ